jgi:hypothetical protein
MNQRHLNLVVVIVLVGVVVTYCSSARAQNPEVAYSDPVADGIVQCSVWTGSTPARVATVPVVNRRCEFDYSAWTAGTYKIRFKGIDATGVESPLSPDSVTVQRTNYVTFYRWKKTISWKCPPGKPCYKE